AEPGRVDEMTVGRARKRGNRAPEPLDRQGKFWIAGKLARQHLGKIDHHDGGARLDGRQYLLVARHHDVTAEYEIGAARRHPDRVNVFRVVGKPDVAVDRTAFLGEARHIDDADALAFTVRRHG